ncbi:MAG: hypothetical protein ABFD75_13815 [Smithella sp.]
MKVRKILLMISVVFLFFSSAAIVSAGDFDWMRDFNIQAQADSEGFRARLATRFQIGDARISAVIGNVPSPGDAYMVFRLGEMSHHPPEEVLGVYKSHKGKGWGVIAKELGIKPGSKEFHALKRGHDLGGDFGSGKKADKGKNKKEKKDKTAKEHKKHNGKDKGDDSDMRDTGNGHGKGHGKK